MDHSLQNLQFLFGGKNSSLPKTRSGLSCSGWCQPHTHADAGRDFQNRQQGDINVNFWHIWPIDLFPQILDMSQNSCFGSTAAQASFQPSQQIGASEPLGFFDPLGFTAVDDEEGFRKLRASEIKHGRVLTAKSTLSKSFEKTTFQSL